MKWSGILLALTSMTCLGISNYLYKRSTQVMSPINTTFYYYLFSFGIAVVIWLLFREREPVGRSALVWPALIAVFLFSSVLTFNYAIQQLNVSIGATIRSLSFIVTIVLAATFSKETFAPKDYVAIALAVGAVLLFGYEGGNQSTPTHSLLSKE